MKTPEITLKLKTEQIGIYNIEDMEKMFGNRIKKAIHIEIDDNGKITKAIIFKEIKKICKPWKFWNKDIREAYKKYQGIILVPWIIINNPPLIQYKQPTKIDENLELS